MQLLIDIVDISVLPVLLEPFHHLDQLIGPPFLKQSHLLLRRIAPVASIRVGRLNGGRQQELIECALSLIEYLLHFIDLLLSEQLLLFVLADDLIRHLLLLVADTY